MSWLSGGLSQFSSFTDQISSFTKEVLTETTEEIEDPTAELQVARKKIEELEDVNNHYKTEWEKLKRHCEEVGERAETAECQIAAISQEYRKLLQEKDNELRRLKSETASLREQQRKLVPTGDTTPSPLKELASARFFPDSERIGGEGREGGEGGGGGGGGGGEGVWESAILTSAVEGEGRGWEGGGGGGDMAAAIDGWEEFHDFGDVISSQGEINRLQTELSRVQLECRHWKTLAKEKGHSGSGGPVEAELASLRGQVEDLQLCLQRERGQHQREISALHATHQEKLHNLSNTQHPKPQEHGPTNPAVDGARASLWSALQDVSLDEQEGEEGVGEVRVWEGRKGEESAMVASLEKELGASRDKCEQLERELNRLRLDLQQAEERVGKERGWEMEREKEKISGLQMELESLRAEKAELEHSSTAARHRLERELEQVKEERVRLQEQNTALHSQAEKVEEERGEVGKRLVDLERQLEMMREECEGGREKLDQSRETVSQLQQQLRESLSSNEGLEAQVQQLVSENSELSSMNAKLRNSTEGEKSRTLQLHKEVEHLRQHFSQEKEAYLQHTEQEKNQLTSTITELQACVSEHEQCIARLQTQCEQSQREADTLTTQIGKLSEEIEVRDRQLERKGEWSGTVEVVQARGHSEMESGEGKTLLVSEVHHSESKGIEEQVSESVTASLRGGPRAEETGARDGLETELLGVREELQVERKRCERLQAHLARLSEEHNTELEQLVAEKEELESEVRRLGKKAEERQNGAIGGGKEMVGEKRMDMGSVEGGEGSHCGAEMVDGSAVEEMLEGNSGERDALVSQLQASLVAAESEKMEFQRSLERSDAELKTLQQIVEKLETKEREMAEALVQGEGEKEALRKECQQKGELRYVVQDRESRIAQLEMEVREMRSQLVQVEKQLSAAEREGEERELLLQQQKRNLQEVGELLRAKEEEVEMSQREQQESRRREEALAEKCRGLETAVEDERRRLSERIVSLEDALRQREEEMSERRQRKKEEVEKERDVKEDRSVAMLQETLRQTEEDVQAKSSQLELVTAERDRLVSDLRVKEGEMTQLLAKLAEAHKTIESWSKEKEDMASHSAQLSQQLEAVRAEVNSLRAERDQLGRREGVLKEGSRSLEGRVRAKEAECAKLVKQLEQLKTHLVQVEERHTEDCLMADQREREHRKKVEELQEMLKTTSYAGQQESFQTRQQLSALEEQLHTLAEQRDTAILQLSSAREEAEGNAAALHNLQSVLEQFQRDQSSELSVALKRSQTELADSLRERERLKTEREVAQKEAVSVAEEAAVLRQQLEEGEKRMTELHKEAHGLQARLHTTEQSLEKLLKEEGGQVDRNLVKNLMIRYVQAPERKRAEVLQLIAKILDFSQTELEQAQGRRGGWLSGLWSRSTTPSSPAPSSPASSMETNSLSRLFVSFLESESTPSLPHPSASMPPSARPPSAGRVDPAADPDRPSRATAAALVSSSSSRHSLPSPPPPPVSLPAAPLAMTTRPAHAADTSTSAKTSSLQQQTASLYSGQHLATDVHRHHESSPKPIPLYASPAGSDSTRSDLSLKHSSTLPVVSGSTPSLVSPAPRLATTTPTSGRPHPTNKQTSPSSRAASGHKDRDLAPAQTRSHSYQSSILKNLLSS